MQKEQKKSFWALIVTQFFGAFNDNLLKTLVTFLILAWVADVHHENSLVSASGAIFVAPFLIFSMLAGRVSDRVSKTSVMRATKFWELLVIVAAIASLLCKSIPWMMVTLFILSMQAAFFSPAKYGVLPEMMSDADLLEANAFLNLSTFAAILIGTMAAGFLTEKLGLACIVMATASLAGLVASFLLQPLPAAKPQESFGQKPAWLAAGMGFVMVFAVLQAMPHRHWHGWQTAVLVVAVVAMLACFTIANAPDLMENWRIITSDRELRLGTIAINYFWFMGAILQLNIFLYAKNLLAASDKLATCMVISVAVGVGLGSYLCGKLAHGEVKLGHVRLGALGMSLFAIDLLWAPMSIVRVFFDFFMLGVAAGFYDIPLMALVQAKSPAAERGRVMATINFLSFVAILAASGVLWLLSNPLQHDPAQVFFTIGSLSLVGTVLVFQYHRHHKT